MRINLHVYLFVILFDSTLISFIYRSQNVSISLSLSSCFCCYTTMKLPIKHQTAKVRSTQSNVSIFYIFLSFSQFLLLLISYSSHLRDAERERERERSLLRFQSNLCHLYLIFYVIFTKLSFLGFDISLFLYLNFISSIFHAHLVLWKISCPWREEKKQKRLRNSIRFPVWVFPPSNFVEMRRSKKRRHILENVSQ